MACLLAAATPTLSACSPPSEESRPLRVTAVVPYWNTEPGAQSVRTHAGTITTSSPWQLGLDQRGRIVNLTGDGGALAAAEQAARTDGMAFQPSLADYSDHDWRDDVVRGIISDSARREAHVAEIVSWVLERRWDGITIDYERLEGRDREAFSTFVSELSAALHKHGKRLAVDVYAKTDDDGSDEAHRSQDLAAIGAAADEVRLMTYTYSWEESRPGPIAPPSWVEQVIRYSLSRVPAEKLVLGLPLFGFDWPRGADATPVSARDVQQLTLWHQPDVHWDDESETPWFTYVDKGGTPHEVWYENACTSATKVALARQYDLAGVFLWMYGPEDPTLWPALTGQQPSHCDDAPSEMGSST